jgi:hypothetical protein
VTHALSPSNIYYFEIRKKGNPKVAFLSLRRQLAVGQSGLLLE